MTAALVPLSLALLALLTVHLLVFRYHWKLADGDFSTAPGGSNVAILGAAIGDVPDDASLAALRTELDTRVAGLPWNRSLVRHNRSGAPFAIQSLFFPFDSAAEALAFCRRLAARTRLLDGHRIVERVDDARSIARPTPRRSRALASRPTPAPPAPCSRHALSMYGRRRKPLSMRQPAPPPKIVYVPALGKARCTAAKAADRLCPVAAQDRDRPRSGAAAEDRVCADARARPETGARRRQCTAGAEAAARRRCGRHPLSRAADLAVRRSTSPVTCASPTSSARAT